jgi:hypothetical protein
MNDTNERSCAARGSGWVAVIAIALLFAGDLSMAVQVPPYELPDEWQVWREEERERKAQAIADAPIHQVQATRQLCDEVAALRKEVAELRAEVAKMRKRK